MSILGPLCLFFMIFKCMKIRNSLVISIFGCNCYVIALQVQRMHECLPKEAAQCFCRTWHIWQLKLLWSWLFIRIFNRLSGLLFYYSIHLEACSSLSEFIMCWEEENSMLNYLPLQTILCYYHYNVLTSSNGL